LSAFVQNYHYTAGAGSFALGQFIAGVKEGNGMNMAFGFSNFKIALANPTFLRSIGNTAILVIIEVPLTIVVSLLIATFLNGIKVLKGFYQTIFFLPYVTNTIALGLVFNIVFSNTPGGLMNILITKFGGDPINWLSRKPYDGVASQVAEGGASRFHQGLVIVLYALWNGLAFKILVFMSGLATIDSQYYNAAKIDGASNFTIWRRITLPLLSPQILYITITSFIGAFKMYTGVMSVYSGSKADAYWFGGEDGNEWIPVVGWIYKTLDSNYGMTGVASAASLILLAIIMFITAIQFAVSKKRVHY
jgi:multiple sugar transport system permease protein